MREMRDTEFATQIPFPPGVASQMEMQAFPLDSAPTEVEPTVRILQSSLKYKNKAF